MPIVLGNKDNNLFEINNFEKKKKVFITSLVTSNKVYNKSRKFVLRPFHGVKLSSKCTMIDFLKIGSI